MTKYYIEPILNRDKDIVGVTEIKATNSRSKSALDGKTEIDMNGIDFSDYAKNPKDYYVSGNTLHKVDRVAQLALWGAHDRHSNKRV